MVAGGRSEAAQGQLEGLQHIDGSLQKVLDRFGKTVAEREKQERKTSQKAEIIQLPLWPEATRGVPNSFLRGALFAAVQGNKRKAMQREILASQDGITIRFTGIQLDQSDLDVWEQVLEFAKHHPLGTRCEFRAKTFLKALGRNTGKSDREWLKDSAARLAGGAAEITHGRHTYAGSFLDFYRDEATERYVIFPNQRIKALYEAGYTQIDWEQRKLLRRKPLALWLHGFLASHASPFPMKAETIMALSGSQNRSVRDFKRQLKAALEELKAIGAIIGYRFDGDLLHVERVPSPSQQRHLANQAKRHR